MLVASQFESAQRERIADLLATLASLGQARTLADGRFVAALPADSATNVTSGWVRSCILLT